MNNPGSSCERNGHLTHPSGHFREHAPTPASCTFQLARGVGGEAGILRYLTKFSFISGKRNMVEMFERVFFIGIYREPFFVLDIFLKMFSFLRSQNHENAKV